MSARAFRHGQNGSMAGVGLPSIQIPPSAPSIPVNKSSSKPPLRTYSKRALQDTLRPLSKRQRIELPTLHVESSTKSGVPLPNSPSLPRPEKRSIAQYFKPVAHSKASSSPQPSIFSSDPVQDVASSPPPSPPSSPPSPGISLSTAPPKKRAKRRLIARRPLVLINMSDLNAGGSKECGKGNGKAVDSGYADPERSPYHPNLMGALNQDLGEAVRSTVTEVEEDDHEEAPVRRLMDDIPRSEPIDIPGARERILSQLMGPFNTQPANTISGPLLLPSEMAALRQRSFGSADTLVGSLTPGSEATFGSADTMVDTHQPMGIPIEHPANLTNRAPPIQSHGAGPSVARASTNSVVASMIQPNIPAASNATQGLTNLVQTRLEIGRAAVLTCGVCNFTWNRTIAADCEAHKEFHENHLFGVPIVGLMTTPRYHILSVDTRTGLGDYVVMIDRSSTEGWKNAALTVLARVDRELGSVPIAENILWSSIPDPAASDSATVATEIARFKIYLYIQRKEIRSGRAVSALLAERITTGYETNGVQIEADEFGHFPSRVRNTQRVVSKRAHEAVLGVNKLWTVYLNQRNGYAKTLLDQARQTFIPSYIIPRVHIAWTCTTNDGAGLAKAYLESEADYDFLTYDDEL